MTNEVTSVLISICYLDHRRVGVLEPRISILKLTTNLQRQIRSFVFLPATVQSLGLRDPGSLELFRLSEDLPHC